MCDSLKKTWWWAEKSPALELRETWLSSWFCDLELGLAIFSQYMYFSLRRDSNVHLSRILWRDYEIMYTKILLAGFRAWSMDKCMVTLFHSWVHRGKGDSSEHLQVLKFVLCLPCLKVTVYVMHIWNLGKMAPITLYRHQKRHRW